MRKWYLEYLVDPMTKESLTLEVTSSVGDRIVSGHLFSSTNTYPIIRGVPRFAGFDQSSQYVNSFGYQWGRWGKVQFEEENKGRPMEGHTRRMWGRISGNDADDLNGQIIGDFGCGPGRFIDVVRKKNASVIALELSMAVESAGEYFRDDPSVLVCQADILCPPIRTASLDGAFSIGVLHHTPNPEMGFQKMVETVRPGGWVASSVYGRSSYYDFPTVRFWRVIFKRLWPVFGHYPPLAYAYLTAYGLRPISYIPVIGQVLRALLPCARYPDVRWSVLDTFDSVTPTYQSTHGSHEVFQWYKRAGLHEIEPSDWGFTSYHAKRPSSF